MNQESDTAAHREIELLRQRVAELERAMAESEQRERELRESEARYQVVLDWSDNGTWEWHLVTQAAHMSPGWFKLFGYEPGEVPNRAETWQAMILPEDLPRTADAFKAHLAGQTPTYEVEHRMRHKSGKLLWIRTRGKVYERDADGRPLRIVGNVTDITRQKVAEDELRRSQSVLQGLVDNSPAPITVRDLSWRYMVINKEAEAALHLDRSSVLGKPDYEITSPEEIALSRATDKVVLETRESVSSERVILKNGEPHSYMVIKFPILDDAGEMLAIAGIATDITYRKRAEEERLAMQERIIAAQTSAIRELSTPLLPISSDVVVMPLIGTIDSQRAQQLMATLLEGVVEHRAATVIIDVTGVEVVDTQVANTLVQASKAVRLLGAGAVLTGIRPEVAQTLVSMGAELGDIVIHGSLRGGIAYALARGVGAERG